MAIQPLKTNEEKKIEAKEETCLGDLTSEQLDNFSDSKPILLTDKVIEENQFSDLWNKKEEINIDMSVKEMLEKGILSIEKRNDYQRGYSKGKTVGFNHGYEAGKMAIINSLKAKDIRIIKG